MINVSQSRKGLFQAWVMWFLGSSFVLYKYIIEVSPSVMTLNMMSYFSIGGGRVGLLISAYFISYMLMQIPIGLLVDRYGAKAIMSLCILLCALGSFWLSSTSSFYAAFAARFLTGLGAAAAVIGCMKLIAMWFPADRFALMVGLMMSVGMLGAVLGQMPLNLLIHHLNWQAALKVIAFCGFAFFLLFILLVREANEGDCQKQPAVMASLRSVTQKRQTWWLSVFSGLAFAPVSALGGAWGVPFLQTVNNVPSNTASFAISAIFYGFALGSPFWGWLSDRYRCRVPFMLLGTSVAVLSSVLLIFIVVQSAWALSLQCFIFGFFISAFVLSFSMIREVNLIMFAASSVGFMNMFNSLTSAVIDPMIGKLLDLFSKGGCYKVNEVCAMDFRIAMLVIPVTLVVALLLLIFCVNETHCQQVES